MITQGGGVAVASSSVGAACGLWARREGRGRPKGRRESPCRVSWRSPLALPLPAPGKADSGVGGEDQNLFFQFQEHKN